MANISESMTKPQTAQARIEHFKICVRAVFPNAKSVRTGGALSSSIATMDIGTFVEGDDIHMVTASMHRIYARFGEEYWVTNFERTGKTDDIGKDILSPCGHFVTYTEAELIKRLKRVKKFLATGEW